MDGGTKYRAHIFTNSGALTISSATADATIEYLVVGGGGGGGYTNRFILLVVAVVLVD